jgi:hypothetical protein
MPDPDPAPPPDRRSTAATLVVALVGILVVAGIIGALGGGDDEPAGQPAPTTTRPAAVETTSPPSTARKPDAGAQAACRHFRNVMRDVAAGILTDAELREKFREVQRSASVSEEPGLAAAGTRLLASITTGTTEELLTAAGEFDKQCDQAGL